MTLDQVAAPATLTGNEAILVAVTNPESPFGGVVINLPLELPTDFPIVDVTNPESPFGGVQVKIPSVPIVVDFTTQGGTGGGDGGTAQGAVSSVFGRQGAVVANSGDYSLDQIYPPAVNWVLAGKLRIKSNGEFQLWNPDQSKWHSIQVHGIAGGEYLTIGAGET